ADGAHDRSGSAPRRAETGRCRLGTRPAAACPAGCQGVPSICLQNSENTAWSVQPGNANTPCVEFVLRILAGMAGRFRRSRAEMEVSCDSHRDSLHFVSRERWGNAPL